MARTQPAGCAFDVVQHPVKRPATGDACEEDHGRGAALGGQGKYQAGHGMRLLGSGRIDALLEHGLTVIENLVERGGHGADEVQRPNILPKGLAGQVAPEIFDEMASMRRQPYAP